MANALADLGKHWDSLIVPVLAEQTIGRKLLPRNAELSGKGLGLTSVVTRSYTARSEAVINYDIQEGLEDTVDITAKTLKIPVLQADTIIKRREWDAYKDAGTPVDSDMAVAMAVQIAAKEDAYIIQGWTEDDSTYTIPGMYQVANNTIGGNSFGTAGKAKAAVAAAIAALKTDKIYSLGWNLGLHPDQHEELDASILTSGAEEYELVLKMLNRGAAGNPGMIYETTNLTAGTGMLSPIASPANSRFFEYIEAQRPKHSVWYPSDVDTGPVRARLLSALGLRFKHLNDSNKTNAICTITGI